MGLSLLPLFGPIFPGGCHPESPRSWRGEGSAFSVA